MREPLTETRTGTRNILRDPVFARLWFIRQRTRSAATWRSMR
jgi:hypothetical protein